MKDLAKVIGAVVMFVVVICLFALLFALPLMWLWNWLMPTIFGLTTITFWQAVGLNVITGMLFRSNINTSPKQ